MPTAQKIVTSFFLILSVFLITTPAYAAFDPKDYQAPEHTAYTLNNLMGGGLCVFGGINPGSKCPAKIVTPDGKSELGLYDRVPGNGAIGSVTTVMAALYNPPTSTTQYLADAAQGFGLIKPAYAQVQGSGAGIIEPVKSLWEVVRNISYLVFIIVFLVVGFMIMFRQKMNPQTVITAQAALPGLIVGLILVTFSYFIASLIIDSSFLGIQLVAKIISQANQGQNAFGNEAGIMDLAQNSSVFNLFGVTVTQFPSNVGDITGGAYRTFFGSPASVSIGSLLTAIGGAIIGGILGFGLPGALIGGGLGGALGGLVVPGLIGLIVPLILLIALFIQMFRLLFNLIGTYIQLLVATVTGPLIILAGSIPGRGGLIGNWLKALIANSLVFPAVFAAFLFAGMILATSVESWRAAPPLFGGLSTELLRVLIAYGILLGIPAIPDMIRNALGVKGPQGFTQAALGGFMGGVGVGQAGANRAWGNIARERQAYREAVLRQRYTPPAAGGGVPAPANPLVRWFNNP